MRLLLDTHAVVWSILELDKLSAVAREAIEDETNTVLVSIASAWEIAIKVGRGNWPAAESILNSFESCLATASFDLLPITLQHVRAAGLMQARHRDPHLTGCLRRRRNSTG